MDSHSNKNKTKGSAVRHYALVMAFAVLCISVPALLFNFVQKESYEAEVAPTVLNNPVATSTATGMARSMPVHLRIPAIHVDVPFEEPLGLNADKTIEAPRAYTDVGWYKYGATPGEVGPAVVLGHVDTYKGPAVFYLLGQLKQGDEIFIDRADGSTATFEVQELHRYLQSDFPSQLVYGPVSYPALRLITCTGTYDHGIQRYDHNLVVFATLKESTSTSVVNGI